MSLGKSFGRCCFLLFEEVGGAECEIVGTQLRRHMEYLSFQQFELILQKQ